MSHKPKMLIEIEGNTETYIGEIDNTTKTLMKFRDEMKKLGIVYVEKKGLSFLSTTMCG